MRMKQNECHFYDYLPFDMSQFEAIYDGIDCSTYRLDGMILAELPLSSEQYLTSPLVNNQVVQSRAYDISQWSVVSIDIFLGLMGGFVGIIWSIVQLCIGGY